MGGDGSDIDMNSTAPIGVGINDDDVRGSDNDRDIYTLVSSLHTRSSPPVDSTQCSGELPQELKYVGIGGSGDNDDIEKEHGNVAEEEEINEHHDKVPLPGLNDSSPASSNDRGTAGKRFIRRLSVLSEKMQDIVIGHVDDPSIIIQVTQDEAEQDSENLNSTAHEVVRETILEAQQLGKGYDELAIEFESTTKSFLNMRLFRPEDSLRLQRRKLKSKFRKYYESTCQYVATVVYDKSHTPYYLWSSLVALAVMYNLMAVMLAISFPSFFYAKSNRVAMIVVNYIVDIVYIFDIFVNARLVYRKEGLNVNTPALLRGNYMASGWPFFFDIISLLPLDFLWRGQRIFAGLRFFRYLKFLRLKEFYSMTVRRSKWPNAWRTIILVANLVVVVHHFAGFYSLVSKREGYGSDDFVLPPPEGAFSTFSRRFLASIFWSTATLTAIGGTVPPVTTTEIFFATVTYFVGILLFSAVVGYVSTLVMNSNSATSNLTNTMDSIKRFMKYRSVPPHVQNNIIRWYQFTTSDKTFHNEAELMESLPSNLRNQIALCIHLDSLLKVSIFHDIEHGFLKELVMKLRPAIFSPGDYVCRKGDIGREMYIISSGFLDVVVGDNDTVVATLGASSYFGEVSCLGMGTGNKRTASVRSRGYSNLFVLEKYDLQETLVDYPRAREILEEKAKLLLKKDIENQETEKLKRDNKGMYISEENLLESRSVSSIATATGSEYSDICSVHRNIGSKVRSPSHRSVKSKAAVSDDVATSSTLLFIPSEGNSPSRKSINRGSDNNSLHHPRESEQYKNGLKVIDVLPIDKSASSLLFSNGRESHSSLAMSKLRSRTLRDSISQSLLTGSNASLAMKKSRSRGFHSRGFQSQLFEQPGLSHSRSSTMDINNHTSLWRMVIRDIVQELPSSTSLINVLQVVISAMNNRKNAEEPSN